MSCSRLRNLPRIVARSCWISIDYNKDDKCDGKDYDDDDNNEVDHNHNDGDDGNDIINARVSMTMTKKADDGNNVYKAEVQPQCLCHKPE